MENFEAVLEVCLSKPHPSQKHERSDHAAADKFVQSSRIITCSMHCDEIDDNMPFLAPQHCQAFLCMWRVWLVRLKFVLVMHSMVLICSAMKCFSKLCIILHHTVALFLCHIVTIYMWVVHNCLSTSLIPSFIPRLWEAKMPGIEASPMLTVWTSLLC